jgi:hypothetical protein
MGGQCFFRPSADFPFNKFGRSLPVRETRVQGYSLPGCQQLKQSAFDDFRQNLIMVTLAHQAG